MPAIANKQLFRNCLEEAEYLASLTPVRLDLLLSLTRQENRETPAEIKSEVRLRDSKLELTDKTNFYIFFELTVFSSSKLVDCL